MSKGIKFTEPSKTVQSDAPATDINFIVNRARMTGSWGQEQRREGMYLDCTKLTDFQSCLDKVRRANDVFNELPARVRDRFRNNIGELVRFVQDPRNRQEAEDLGIIEKKVPKVDDKVSEKQTEPAK